MTPTFDTETLPRTDSDSPTSGKLAGNEATLRETLKRCSPGTIEAAIQYHRTGDHHLVPAVVLGIIERFVERDLRPRIAQGSRDLRLTEDLSIDSLTMMEIVMLTEEALSITINNDELRPLRTLGDVQVFAECKARGIALPPSLRDAFRESVSDASTGAELRVTGS